MVAFNSCSDYYNHIHIQKVSKECFNVLDEVCEWQFNVLGLPSCGTQGRRCVLLSWRGPDNIIDKINILYEFPQMVILCLKLLITKKKKKKKKKKNKTKTKQYIQAYTKNGCSFLSWRGTEGPKNVVWVAKNAVLSS